MPDLLTGYDLFVKRWSWLFPFIFFLHILEEYFGGFHLWISGITGKEPSISQFLIINILCLLIMIAGIISAMRAAYFRGLAVAFAVAVVINSFAHFIAGIVTATYSPGVFTGMLLWLPAGVYTIYLANKALEKSRLTVMILTGVGLHLAVFIVGIIGGTALSNK
jgi:hypothetical protein